jgi:glucosamine 6-phosphate synthetase-like amidotransferase/phosphosugar isomerase protein
MSPPTPSQPARFLDDLLAKPAALARLRAALEVPGVFRDVPTPADRIVLLGMGSSRYAAEVTAARLRAAGVHAVAEVASAAVGTAPGPGTLAIAISATGGSVETLAALERHRGRSRVVAITNRPGAPVTEGADAVLDLVAGEEASGVACRTFQHTLLLLRALEAHLGGEPVAMGPLIDGVARATEHLLATRDDWLPAVDVALEGPDGVHAIAPAERWSSAMQSALMVREGPRRPATGSETGDWSHVDVYLTKTRDYRALFFPGSRWDAQALDWLTQRRSTWVAVGGVTPGATATVRYPGDTDPAIALATETLVAELFAQRWWARQGGVAEGDAASAEAAPGA